MISQTRGEIQLILGFQGPGSSRAEAREEKDYPGKNPGTSSHFLIEEVKVSRKHFPRTKVRL